MHILNSTITPIYYTGVTLSHSVSYQKILFTFGKFSWLGYLFKTVWLLLFTIHTGVTTNCHTSEFHPKKYFCHFWWINLVRLDYFKQYNFSYLLYWMDYQLSHISFLPKNTKCHFVLQEHEVLVKDFT